MKLDCSPAATTTTLTEDDFCERGSIIMPDKTLVCNDCNTQFTFTEGEQEFFSTKGFTPPTRCADCRARRKAEKMAGDGGGSSFGGGNRGGGGGGGGRGRSRGW